MLTIIGFLLATLVGLSLGLIGAGGSILTLPILIYCFGFLPVESTSYSLFIVGFTSLVGIYSYAKRKEIDYWIAFIFGFPSIITVYFVRRYLMPILPREIAIGDISISNDMFIMTLFSVLMFAASISLIKGVQKIEDVKPIQYSFNYVLNIFIYGFGVGILTGIVGAGGGFLVTPTLILLAHLPIKKAIGTCLVILSAKSLIGFMGDFQNRSFDWVFIFIFCVCTSMGIFWGVLFSKKIGKENLRNYFGYFELILSVIIFFKEIVFKLFPLWIK